MANLDEVVNAATDVIRCRGALASCKEQLERLFKERHVHQDNLELAEKKLRAVCEPPVSESRKPHRAAAVGAGHVGLGPGFICTNRHSICRTCQMR